MSESPLLRDVIEIIPTNDVLTDAVLDRLKEVWGDLTATDIAAKSKLELARDMMVVLPDSDGFTAKLRLQVASGLRELFKELELLPQQSPQEQAAPTSQPQTIKVVMDKSYDQMDLIELLEKLNAETYAEIRSHLDRNQRVQAASMKADGKWVVVGERGINVGATLRYITHLNKRFSSAQREFEGARPTTLDRALGIDDRPIISFLTGRPVQGPDENGFDLTTLPEDRRDLPEAGLYAASIGHPMFPKTIDPYEHASQLFEPTLNKRWKTILDDYRTALADGDPQATRISRYWPADVPLDRTFDAVNLTFNVMVNAPATPDYEAMVREAAMGDCRRQGMSVVVRGGVYKRLVISGMSPSIQGVVVTEGGSISGMSASGTVYAPPGVSVSVNGMSSNVDVHNVSWKKLAEILHLV